MSSWFLLASAIVQYQRKIKLLNNFKKTHSVLLQWCILLKSVSVLFTTDDRSWFPVNHFGATLYFPFTFYLWKTIFNEGKVALRAFKQTKHYKRTRFSSSTGESASGKNDIDGFGLNFS